MVFAMTRKEFSATYDAYMRQGSRLGRTIVGAILVVTIAGAFLANHIEKRYDLHRLDDVVAFSLLALMICGAIALVWLDRLKAQKLGLVCTACNRSLTGKERRRKVLLTGNCPNCGSKVFDKETSNRAIPRNQFDREAFKTELDDFNRHRKWLTIKVVVIYLAVMAASVPMAKWLLRAVDRGDFDWVTLEQLRWFAVAVLATLFVFAVWVAVLLMKGKHKDRTLPCPECNRSLAGVGKVALESGTCIFCGCQLFKSSSVN